MELQQLDARRHTVQTRSGEISYIDTGAGRVALFVHGIAANALLWRNVIAALESRRRCIALDLPLHGQSPVNADQDMSIAAMASLVEDLCDALGLDRVDLVANDVGGAIAQVVAARSPQRLSTLTLTNCGTSDNLPSMSFKPVAELAAAGALAPVLVELFKHPKAALDLFGTAYEHPELADLEVIRAYLEPCIGTFARACWFERLLVSLDPGDLKAVEPQLMELTVPTLVAWGTGDMNFDISCTRWLRDAIPGVTRVALIDGARLFFPEERADEFAALLEQHWAEHHPARGS